MDMVDFEYYIYFYCEAVTHFISYYAWGKLIWEVVVLIDVISSFTAALSTYQSLYCNKLYSFQKCAYYLC